MRREKTIDFNNFFLPSRNEKKKKKKTKGLWLLIYWILSDDNRTNNFGSKFEHFVSLCFRRKPESEKRLD